MSMVDRARELRPLIEKAANSLTDEEAISGVELFSHWSSDSVEYAAGDRVSYQGLLYKCLQAHTSQESWTPKNAVSIWVRVDNPEEEYPEWRQPAGAHDAYQAGYKVSHNNKRWTSDVDNNVWEPGVYGWSEVI